MERLEDIKYFDYTATTPVDDEVLNTYVNTTKKFFANTTSLHYLGEESKHMYEKCMNMIKDILNVKHHNLVFTSNATEANNLAIFGICDKYKNSKVISTKIEHPSVYNTMKMIEKNHDVVYLDIKNDGRIDLNALKKEIDDNTILVSIMWVNNIIGTIQDIKEIIKICKKYPKCHLHVDCVQGICKVNPDFDFNDIDLFTFSTHKLYGPKGIGGLFYKDSIDLEKRIFGSTSQYSIKPGTLDVSLIASSAKCFKKFYPLIEENRKDVKDKFLYLYNHLKDNDKITINTPLDNITYYILSLSIRGIKGETIVHALEQEKIYVSTGSSCSSKSNDIEKTIYALTKDEELARSSIRISLSFKTTYEEIDALIKALNKITKK